MKRTFVAAVLLAAGMAFSARATPQEQSTPAPTQASSPSETQPAPRAGIIEGMLAQSSTSSGYLDAQQVKALLDQVRFTEFRINDLLTDVHPDRWKLSPAARDSFNQTVGTMRSQLTALKEWRGRFAERPEGIYAGFETYSTIGAILPRLEGVARTITQADNASFGAQFYESADRLFDLQQKLAPYVGFLSSNQDSISQSLENNLAGCQNQLGIAMRGRSERPKMMKNSAPVRARRTQTKPEPTRVQGETMGKKESGADKPQAEHPQN